MPPVDDLPSPGLRDLSWCDIITRAFRKWESAEQRSGVRAALALMVETGCEADREPRIEWRSGMAALRPAGVQQLSHSSRKGRASTRPRMSLRGLELTQPSFDLMTACYEPRVFHSSAIYRRVCRHGPVSEDSTQMMTQSSSPLPGKSPGFESISLPFLLLSLSQDPSDVDLSLCPIPPPWAP